MQIQKIEISKLTGDPANARKHGDRNIQTIVESLNRFGQQKPIVVDSSNCVRAGNGTLEAARSLGWTHLDCVVTELKGSDAIAYAIADNRTAELAEWDDGVLIATLEGLQLEGLLSSAGFSDDELAELMKDIELDGDGTTGEVPEQTPGIDRSTQEYLDGNEKQFQFFVSAKDFDEVQAAIEQAKNKSGSKTNSEAIVWKILN